MIDTLIFDAYGTLFDEGRESIPKVARYIVIDLSLKLEPEVIFESWSKNYFSLEKRLFDDECIHSFKTIRDINTESLRLTFNQFGINADPSKYINLLFRWWCTPNLFPEVRDVIKELSPKYKIGIVSNADNETLFSALEHTKLNVDYVLTSEIARSYKPNKNIFIKCLNDLNVKKSNILYVGNSIADILGAKSVGLTMVWVNRKGITIDDNLPKPDYEVKNLSYIPKIIKKINY